MIEKINMLLETIVNRIEVALPKVTEIDKIKDLGTLLVKIKEAYNEPKYNEDVIEKEIREEI